MNPEVSLRVVKTLHTVIWAFFVACILAIPSEAWLGKFEVVLVLIALVTLEVSILALNSWRCPLTRIAARFTSDRRDNFDIYLPQWLARNTMRIFGPLFLFALLAAFVLWSASQA